MTDHATSHGDYLQWVNFPGINILVIRCGGGEGRTDTLFKNCVLLHMCSIYTQE